MSFETWKEEYYPVGAAKVSPGLPSIEHSLQKWRGLRVVNMEKHGVFFDDNYEAIRSSDSSADVFIRGDCLVIDASSCALCHNAVDADGHGISDCEVCPLAMSRDGVPCDECVAEDYSASPYKSFVSRSDPEPMITALEKCRVWWLAKRE